MNLKIQMDDLVYNKESNCFETKLKFYSSSYSMTICDFKDTEYKQAEKLALELKNWLEKNMAKAKEYAALKLLKLKNDRWLADNEKPISHEQFITTIQFDGISAFAEGGFEIYFSDGNLFLGHTIIVDVDEAFKFEDSNIAG